MSYYVYILTNKPDGILYIGVTSDLQRRIGQHRAHTVKGFSADHKLDRLVYVESYERAEEAIHREKCMKEWKRAWKVRRILETNSEWRDLSNEWL